MISIHALREESDAGLRADLLAVRISIHALREESDAPVDNPPANYADFYPRPPRGERRRGKQSSCPGTFISIHALREESDDRNSGNCNSGN